MTKSFYSTSKSLIDSVPLMEMPRYVLPYAKNFLGRKPATLEPPDIDTGFKIQIFRNYLESTIEFVQITVIHQGTYGSGFEDIELDGSDTIQKPASVDQIKQAENAVKEKYSEQILKAKIKLIKRFKASQAKLKAKRSMEVPLNPDSIPTIDLGGDPTSVLTQKEFGEKFRWTSGVDAGEKADSLMALLQLKKEGDTLYRLVHRVEGARKNIRGRAYALLNKEEEEELKRMIRGRARRKVDRAMREALITEMPNHYIRDRNPNPRNPRNQVTSVAALSPDLDYFTVWATAHLESGENEIFQEKIRISPSMLTAYSRAGDISSSSEYKRLQQDALDRVKKKAQDWLDANKREPVKMGDIETYKIRSSAIPIIKDLRYISLRSGAFGLVVNDVETAVQFISRKNPEDRVIQVIDDRGQGGDHINFYYILLNPQEYVETRRKIVDEIKAFATRSLDGEDVEEGVLLEMPLHKLEPMDPDADPETQETGVKISFEYSVNSNDRILLCVATATTPSGDSEKFTAKEKMSGVEVSTFKRHGYSIHAVNFKSKMTATKEAARMAKEWADKSKTDTVRIPRIRRVKVNWPIVPMIREFRYMKSTRQPDRSDDMATVASFMSGKGPEDTIVCVCRNTSSYDDVLSSFEPPVYFVLLNPEELMIFNKRVISGFRDKAFNVLDEQ